MATLVVIPTTSETAALDETVEQRFGNKAFQLPRGEWLVAYDGTSKQFCDEMGITDGSLARAVVLNWSGYYGNASKTIWEWISQNS